MRISDVKTYIVGNPWKNWTFVKLYTDEGLYGWGEATQHRAAKTAEANVLEMKRYYMGRDPFDVEGIWFELQRANAAIKTIAAIDMACWDIIGKALGVPVHRIIGGRLRERVRAYANGWYQAERTPEAFAERARQVVDRGYTAMKFDPFGSAWDTMSRSEIALSLDIVEAVRETVGPDVELFIEAHRRFNPVSAVKIGRLLEKYDPGWYEEPVSSRQIDDLAAIGAQLTVPIAAGEGLHTKEEFEELLSNRAAQIIQPDPTSAGGITEMKKIAAVAQAHHVLLAPHNAQGPLCTAACLQIDASTSNFFIQETFEDFATPLASEIVEHRLQIEDGFIEVPERPGLGVELKEEVMAEYPYDESHFLDMYGSEDWQKRNL
ncbi:MAG: mandelate racemase/muconate lactonizing enzyme family protein [Chloroflexota bacterium]|nr:mandelate racemase/muconate lactonizing enzyme family protein [Chloroflexota bacterium]